MRFKDIRIRKLEFVTKTQLLYFYIRHLQGYAKDSGSKKFFLWCYKILKIYVFRKVIEYICLVSYDGVMKGADPLFKWSSCCVVNDEATTEAP